MVFAYCLLFWAAVFAEVTAAIDWTQTTGAFVRREPA
jgi:hypothetical protein